MAGLQGLTNSQFSDSVAAGNRSSDLDKEAINSAQLAKLKEYLQGQSADQAQARDLQGIQKLQQVSPEGASVKAGGMASGVDPMARAVLMQQQGSVKAIKGATDYYNKNVSKLQDKANAAEEGLNATNDPNNMGSVGQARTLMLKAMGMNRYNEQEAKAVMPPTLHSQLANMMNSTGDDSNPLNDSQRQTINSFFKHSLNNVDQQHEMLKSNAISEYQMNPMADPSKSDVLKNQLGAPFTAHLKEIGTKYQQSPGTPKSEGQPPQPGMMDSAVSGLKNFFGGQPQAQPSSAPMTREQYKASKGGQGAGQ